MPSQRGTFEWDDANLAPGRSKDGGLNHNLYGEGKGVKGQARFIPDEIPEELTPAPVESALAQQTWADWLSEAVADAVGHALDNAIEDLKPHIAHAWDTRAVPAMRARLAELRRRHRSRKGIRAARESGASPRPETEAVVEREATALEATAIVDDQKVVMTSEQYRQLVFMASEEFRAMVMAALANAHVEDGQPSVLEQLDEVRELPPAARAARVQEILAAEPTILTDLEHRVVEHQRREK